MSIVRIRTGSQIYLSAPAVVRVGIQQLVTTDGHRRCAFFAALLCLSNLITTDLSSWLPRLHRPSHCTLGATEIVLLTVLLLPFPNKFSSLNYTAQLRYWRDHESASAKSHETTKRQSRTPPCMSLRHSCSQARAENLQLFLAHPCIDGTSWVGG